MDRRTFLASTFAAGAGLPLGAARTRAQAGRRITIGVMTDMSGAFADAAGRGSVEAVRLAVEDAAASAGGLPVEVLSADFQNKPDVGAAIAREWFDQKGVDVIVDIPNSAVALAVQELARERGKVVLQTGSSSTALSNAGCSPTGFAWNIDTYGASHGIASAVMKSVGATWFLLVADYAYGHQMQADLTKVIETRGGKVVGVARHPPNSPDFSSYLLAAQASGARVIALANGPTDLVNATKQAHEFGLIREGERSIVMPLITIQTIDALGLATADRAFTILSCYWDLNDASRAWSKRFEARMGRAPTHVQQNAYSASMHYLKAVRAAGTADGTAVAAAMRAAPVEEFGETARIRADGRVVRDHFLCRTKAPSASRGRWDLFDVVQRIPAEDAVWPMSESGCRRLAP